MIHIRYEGRSRTAHEQDLRVQGAMSDQAIKEAVARHLQVEIEDLRFYVVDRTANNDLIVRPEAVYG